MTLDQIGLECHTDKASDFHDYLRSYEMLLDKNAIKSVLEIGIWHGFSLRMWQAWLPDAKIYGVDKALICGQIPGVVMEQADSTKAGEITPFLEKYGPFDLIVDDGSHDPDDQHKTFELCYPYVNPGGYYIIEDVQHAESRFGGTAVCGVHHDPRDNRDDFVWFKK